LKTDKISNRFLAWVQSATAGKETTDGPKLAEDLARAGFEHPTAPILYVVCRFALAIGLPFLWIASQFFVGPMKTGMGTVAIPLVLCGVGLITPKVLLDRRIDARRAQIEREFPDTLDLLVICVEAGLGLESAFVRVAREVQETHPSVSALFHRMTAELNAGRSRPDALRAMANRANVDSIKSFVALLIQTDTLGVSIGQSLRTYSNEMRETRYLKAEEKAMRIPVLMTLPVVGCFMPVIIVALLLPPVIDMVRNFGPALQNTGGPSTYSTIRNP
jgi:tight adherence protein C